MIRSLLLLLLLPQAVPPSEGVYVAVGYGGRRLVSRDGVAWEISAEWAVDGKDDSNNLISVAYGKGRFVAVGGGGWTRETQAGHILVSKDGREWTEARKAPNRISPIVFGDDRFVAGASDKSLLWSEDGETWKPGGRIDYKDWAFWFRRCAHGNGTFVFMGNHGKDQKAYWCAVSRNAESIDHFATDLPVVAGLAFGAGLFVTVGAEGLVQTSADGREWKRQTIANAGDFQQLAWTPKGFLAVGKKVAFTSADGQTWTALSKKPPCHLLWADATITIGTTWPGQMWNSTDGTTWTKGAGMTPNGINEVVYGAVGK
ncbi:MAG TPA: hypothetical protein VE981_21130 [Planctomycetota bacterium]|nr:hypothetical protein [Planctomycetota bacterium]